MLARPVLLSLLLLGVVTAATHAHDHEEDDDVDSPDNETMAAMEDALTQYMSGLSQADVKRLIRTGLPPFAFEYIGKLLLQREKQKGESPPPVLPDVGKAFAKYTFKEVLRDFNPEDVDAFLELSLDETVDEILDLVAGPLVDDLKRQTAVAIDESATILKDYASGNIPPKEMRSKLGHVIETFQHHLDNAIRVLEIEIDGEKEEDSAQEADRIEATAIGKERAMETLKDIVDYLNQAHPRTTIHDDL